MVNNNTLQDTLNNLIQSGALSNPAYKTLLQDYTHYHTVLFIEGGIVALTLIWLSIYFWKRLKKVSSIKAHPWTFVEKAYFFLGLTSAITTIFMLLIVTANLSNVLYPQKGFAQSIPDLGVPLAGTQKAALYQAVNEWAQSGSTQMPVILQIAVQERLSWQQPKAILCSFLFVALFFFTTKIWQSLIKSSQLNNGRIRGLKEKMQLAIGVTAIPVTVLLMVMALANTQASLAPITLSLLFS